MAGSHLRFRLRSSPKTSRSPARAGADDNACRSDAAASAAAGDAAPARAASRVHDRLRRGYVTYPITVCHPPTVLDEALARNVDASFPGATTGTLEAMCFKLTSHPAIRFALPPWFCSVRGGPWYGRVEGKQICNVDPSVRLFTAQLLGAPDPIVVTWSGKLEDVPPPLKLVAVSPTGQFCTCCSGVMCPAGSCKPTFDSCQVMPPVLK